MRLRSLLLTLCALLMLCPLAACGGAPQAAAAPAPTDAPTLAPSPVFAAIPSPVPTFTPSPRPTVTPSPEPTPMPTPSPVPPMSDPIITLTGGEALTVTAAFAFEDPGAEARDYLGVDLTDRIAVEGEVISYLVGDYELTYSVTDDYGNRTEVRRTVSVRPVELPPVIDPPEKTIYLTFDDGPSGHTEYLLDVLKRYDVKVTFFVVGQRRRKDLIKRAFEEGHSIGVHSYTHAYEKIYASEAAFFEDFLATEEVIREQTGQYSTIFRFPGGSNNTVSRFNRGIMTRLARIMEDMGYRYFDWNASSGDASAGSSNRAVEEYFGILCYRTKADVGPIVILQHDLNGNSVRAVELFIPWAQERGFTFLPLDMTSPVFHDEINN